MLVKFKTNIGSIDAMKLGVDHKQCTCGATLEVTSDAADWLVKRNKATLCESPEIKAAEIKAPAMVPEIRAVPEVKKGGK